MGQGVLTVLTATVAVLAMSSMANGQASAVAPRDLLAVTREDARVQGTVFANGQQWKCVGNSCMSVAYPGLSARQSCRDLVQEVGALRSLRISDVQLESATLDECNGKGLPERSVPAQLSDQFSIAQEGGRYWLLREGGSRLEVPSHWILATAEAAREHEDYVASSEFDELVQEFPIGEGLVGLRLSSYVISREGSAQAAAGRDVFLVFDPVSQTLADGGIRLGISKQRIREAGRWLASVTRFYLQDVNGDGRLDIGVLKETVICWPTGRPDITASGVGWYLFAEGAWIANTGRIDNPISTRGNELPLLGLAKSPVQFVIESCSRKPGRQPAG